MAKVLIPLAPGFEEIEALAVVDILRRAEIEVILAGLHPGPVASARNVRVEPDTTIDNISADDFDMIILPGGQPGTDNLNADPRIHNLLADFSANNKLISAICAAPMVLASAGLLTDKKATCYPTYRKQLYGATYVDAPVVEDGSIMTSQGAGTAILFGLAIAARLAGQATADKVAKAMLVQESFTELCNPAIFDGTIQILLNALELQDGYSQGYSRRIAEYCLGVGSRLGFSKIEMRDLYLGAMLHDIGKFNVTKDILHKPDSLNLREETLTREHTLKGTLFVVGSSCLSHLGPTILHHHEHWDGSGYPSHLKGDQIPLHARIIAIADAYVAMISNRSYRDSQDRQSAQIELIKHKSTQFDPFLVDVFIECLNDSPFDAKDFSYYFN